MVASIAGLLFVLLGLFVLALQRFYSSIPAKELKRLAAREDPLAIALYKPVAYGTSMRLLLWAVFCLSLAGGFFLIISSFVPLAAFLVVLLSVAAIVLLQSIRLTVRSAHFAVKAAPGLNWVLGYLHRPFDGMARGINRFRNPTVHSGLYEKEDLLDLLEQQRNQPDNRIDVHDLDLVTRAAQFADRQAADIAVPMSRVRTVKVGDHIGPVLLGELHQSGQTSFLVYDGTPDRVVGTLLLRDAVEAKEGGKVAQLIHPRVCYVHEDFSLSQTLAAFVHTGQFIAVVINSFEEPVGVIALQQLLAQLVGEPGTNDFDAYEDRKAVAGYTCTSLEPAVAPEPEQAPESTGL